MATLFDRADVRIKGTVSMEATGGSFEIMNGFQDVITIAEGWAGGSKGSVLATVTVDRAVPKAGFDSNGDMIDAVTKQKFIQITIVSGGYRIQVTGVPKAISASFGESKTTTDSFSVHGKASITKLGLV